MDHEDNWIKVELPCKDAELYTNEAGSWVRAKVDGDALARIVVPHLLANEGFKQALREWCRQNYEPPAPPDAPVEPGPVTSRISGLSLRSPSPDEWTELLREYGWIRGDVPPELGGPKRSD